MAEALLFFFLIPTMVFHLLTIRECRRIKAKRR